MLWERWFKKMKQNRATAGGLICAMALLLLLQTAQASGTSHVLQVSTRNDFLTIFLNTPLQQEGASCKVSNLGFLSPSPPFPEQVQGSRDCFLFLTYIRLMQGACSV